MTKTAFKTAAFIMTVTIITGCAAHDETLHSALNKDTQAISDLAREQAKMIASKEPPSEVYNKVLKADPFLIEIRDICNKAERSEKSPANSCAFYKELSNKFTLYMMINAGKYYLKNGNEKESEKLFHEIVEKYNDDANKAEITQANSFLDRIKNWDSTSTGVRAYILGDYKAALEELKLKDDPQSFYTVGQIYYFGYGVPRDVKQAAEWYSKAADKDYAPAEYQVGLLYLNGEGVEQDEMEAKKWFQKSADQDYDPAKKMPGVKLK